MAEIGLLSLGDHIPDPLTGRLCTQQERHRDIIDLAVEAEALGFDSVWIGEHHFSQWIVSVPQMLLSAIAERTTSLRLGTAVTLLPNLDPVRVAEDFATLDLISGGRADVVVGRGILPSTYRAFGSDSTQSREIFEEKLELLLQLWREDEVSWTGNHRPPLTGARLSPRPAQEPHPPLWVGGGGSAASVDLAAALGLPLMLPSVFARPEKFAPFAERYRDHYRAAGHDPAALRVGGCNHLFVASTSQEAIERWEVYYRQYFDFAQRVIRNEGEALLDASRAQFDYDAVRRGPGICGSPAQVAERILETQDMLGLDVHLLMIDLGGMPRDVVRETMELFVTDVLPTVRAGARDALTVS